MPLPSAEAEARLTKQSNVIGVADLTPPTLRIVPGTLAHAWHLAERPDTASDYDFPTAANLKAVIAAAEARIAVIEVREEAVKLLRQRNAELQAADNRLERALAAVGVDYDKRTVRYFDPIDNLSAHPLTHLLVDHNDVIARALGEGQPGLAWWLERAREREGR